MAVEVERGCWRRMTVEGVVTCEWCGRVRHPGPTMDTASECGKTVGGYRIGVRYDD